MPTLYLLELFSGSSSFAKGARAALPPGWKLKVHSLDINPKYHPTTCVDVLKWDYRADIDEFLTSRREKDMVWLHMSPPCQEFSRAKTVGVRDLEGADKIVKRSLRIMTYARPDFFTLENPMGLLETRPFMQKLAKYMHLTSYCRFGKDFRKDTRIWTNVVIDLPVCRRGSYCAAKALHGRHLQTAQSGPGSSGTISGSGGGEKVYPLPKGLVVKLVRAGFKQRAAVAT
jgi:site-specific DNA-cytosine methylase